MNTAEKGKLFRKFWLDFRQGHSIYLVFIMTFANFVTIQYKLLIEKASLGSLFENVWIFAVVFLAIYFPLAIVLGYWHRKSQWKVETEALFRENEIGAALWLFVIRMLDGQVTEPEKKEMIEMLSKIANSKKKLTGNSLENQNLNQNELEKNQAQFDK